MCAAALVLAAQARACVFEIRMSARENCSVLSENARERTRSKFLRFFFGSILSVLLSFWKKNLLNSTVVKPRCVIFRHEEIWTSLDKIFEKEGCQADANKFWEKGKIFFVFRSLYSSHFCDATQCAGGFFLVCIIIDKKKWFIRIDDLNLWYFVLLEKIIIEERI